MTGCKCSACRCGDKMFTVDDYFMGRDRDARFAHLVTPVLRANAAEWVRRANLLIALFYRDHPEVRVRKIRSGWRPPEINAATKGAAKASSHMICSGGDIEDFDGADNDKANDLALWCVNNAQYLEKAELWMEDPRCTPTWVHWQTFAPRSGARFFIPDAAWAARLAGNQLDAGDLLNG